MTLIKNSILVLISTIIISYFRWISVFMAGRLFRKLFSIPIIKNNIQQSVQLRVAFEVIFYLVSIFIFYFLFKLVSKQIKLNKFYLLIVVISPILFDISSIIYDKSCLKPWFNFEKFIWYFPMRLVLWLFLLWFFKDLILSLKSKKNLLLILIIFLIFHTLKNINKYYI